MAILLSFGFGHAQIRKESDLKNGVFVGKATWYGETFQGKITASGERFDYRKFTAAHKFLPMGTYLLVTNLENGRNLLVKVNDRLPQKSPSTIDLSLACAGVLGFKKQGVARVRLQVLKLPPNIPRLWADVWIGAQSPVRNISSFIPPVFLKN